MINTFTGYQLIARDMGKALARVDKQPVVQRESEYFTENIGKVKSVEEFMENDRLYRYAMKAFGLEDMTYAKAFMKKALEGGVSDPDSFANKLTDKRYATFVTAFNFEARKEGTTTYAPAGQGTVDRYKIEAFKAGVDLDSPVLIQQTKDYLAGIGKIKTVDEFLKNDALYSFAMKAFGLTEHIADKALMRDMLEGGVSDANSPANKQKDEKFATFVAAFNFAERGEQATTWRPSVEGVTASYRRQQLEENAGSQNEGVRLALYFQRKAPEITSFYSILADPALAQVLRTQLGLPDAFATSDIDKQVAFFEKRMDIEDFQDPEKLDKFLKTFTVRWEMSNSSSSAQASIATLFSQGIEFGVSTNLMLAIQGMKR